jgi:hypothetical protein
MRILRSRHSHIHVQRRRGSDTAVITDEARAFTGLRPLQPQSKAFTGLRPARPFSRRKRTQNALRRARVVSAPASPIRCASWQPQAGAELTRPCVQTAAPIPCCCLRCSPRFTARCRPRLRIHALQRGFPVPSRGIMATTTARDFVARVEPRSGETRGASRRRNRHQCLFVVLLPLRLLRSLRTGALRFSRGPVVPWSRGPVVPWSRGPVVPWSRGPVVPWSLHHPRMNNKITSLVNRRPSAVGVI